jgi:hypothetical protein
MLAGSPSELSRTSDADAAFELDDSVKRQLPRHRDGRNGFLAFSAVSLGVALGIHIRGMVLVDLPEALGFNALSLPFSAVSISLAAVGGSFAGRVVAAEDYLRRRPARSAAVPIVAGATLTATGLGLTIGGWTRLAKDCLAGDERCTPWEFRRATGLLMAGTIAATIAAGALGFGVGHYRGRRGLQLGSPSLGILPGGGFAASMSGRF